MNQILPGSQIPFGRLERRVAQRLLPLVPRGAAQVRDNISTSLALPIAGVRRAGTCGNGLGLMVGSMLMRLKFTLWMLTVLAPVASAAVINCSAGAASVPVFDPSSVSGAVGNYTLDCTGGTPVLPPLPVPQINVDAFMNVSVLTPG